MAISITDTWAQVDPPFGVEIYYSSAWHDISDDVGDAGLEITRGRRKPGQAVPASTLACQLANPTGTYSPRNPNSALYGLIGRGTPVRAWVEAGTPFLDVTSTFGAGASTPDSAALSITGDLELQHYGWRRSWRYPHTTCLIGKWDDVGGTQCSFKLEGVADGYLRLSWSTTGAAGAPGLVQETSTAVLPVLRGELGVKATLDVNDGSGNHVVEFYYSQDGGSSWSQLGDTITTSGTTSIYDGTADLLVGHADGFSLLPHKVYWAKVIEGIGGTTRADPVFEDEDSGTSSFDDAQGNTWTLEEDATLTNRHYRYWGEINSWPQKWGQRGSSTAHSPIAAAGVTQRLEQGRPPLKSAYYRAVTSPTAPMLSCVGYWPMESKAGATIYPSGLPGHPAATASAGAESVDSTSFPCSDALPVVGSDWTASSFVAEYTSTGEIQAFVLVKIPGGGVASDTRLLSVSCTGTAVLWEIHLNSSGNLSLYAYNATGGTLVSSGPIGFGLNGKAVRIGLHLQDIGGVETDWTYSALEVGESSGSYQSGYVLSQSIGRALSWRAGADLGLAGCTIGHVTLQSAVTSTFDLYQPLGSYSGEEAVTRIERLALEEDLDIETLAEGSSEALGRQPKGTVMQLLRDAEASDLGVLYEPRSSAALSYRAGVAMCGQPAQLALDYTGNLLSPFEPVDDTDATRNKITVQSRDSGAEATVEDATGALGTAAVGVFEDSPDGAAGSGLSLGADTQAEGQGYWRLHLGTVDEARWPTIGIDLAHPTLKADADLTRAVLLLDLGDRITVDDPPEWLPPVTVDQIVQGYTEAITPTSFQLRLACTPYSPWRVGVWDQDRYTTDDTVLNGALNSTATTIPITNGDNVEWGHSDGDFSIIVGGEIMTVTAVTGTGTSQTLTVTRSVNGVVKAHADGAEVDLATPFYYGLG